MEAELFKTIAHVAPPEQIPAGKWLTTLNALLKRDVQGGMDWLSQCKQALIKWSDRPQMEGTVAGAYLWDGTGETRLYLLFTDGQRQGGMKNLYAAVCAPSEGLVCRPLCQEEHDFVRQLIRTCGSGDVCGSSGKPPCGCPCRIAPICTFPKKR